MVVLYKIEKDNYGIGKDDETNIADFDSFKQCYNYLVNDLNLANLTINMIRHCCYRQSILLEKYKIFSYRN